MTQEQRMKTKRPLREAQGIAEALVAELTPYCERIEVAGSVRRGKAEVGDLEVVAIPKPITDLFGEAMERTQVDWWLDDSGIVPTKDGPKYKQFLWPNPVRSDWRAIQVDLFLATEDNYGLILMLRTGPAEFSRAMVTLTAWGGYKPADLTVQYGQVWRGGQPVAVPDEESLFALWNMPYINPAERTAEAQRA